MFDRVPNTSVRGEGFSLTCNFVFYFELKPMGYQTGSYLEFFEGQHKLGTTLFEGQHYQQVKIPG